MGNENSLPVEQSYTDYVTQQQRLIQAQQEQINQLSRMNLRQNILNQQQLPSNIMFQQTAEQQQQYQQQQSIGYQSNPQITYQPDKKKCIGNAWYIPYTPTSRLSKLIGVEGDENIARWCKFMKKEYTPFLEVVLQGVIDKVADKKDLSTTKLCDSDELSSVLLLHMTVSYYYTYRTLCLNFMIIVALM